MIWVFTFLTGSAHWIQKKKGFWQKQMEHKWHRMEKKSQNDTKSAIEYFLVFFEKFWNFSKKCKFDNVIAKLNAYGMYVHAKKKSLSWLMSVSTYDRRFSNHYYNYKSRYQGYIKGILKYFVWSMYIYVYRGTLRRGHSEWWKTTCMQVTLCGFGFIFAEATQIKIKRNFMS